MNVLSKIQDVSPVDKNILKDIVEANANRNTADSKTCNFLRLFFIIVIFVFFRIDGTIYLINLFWGMWNYQIKALFDYFPAQGGTEGSVRLLLTKKPACSFSCLLTGSQSFEVLRQTALCVLCCC